MNFWQNGLEELQLFQPKKPVLEQASPKSPFSRYKTHLFEKSCILYFWSFFFLRLLQRVFLCVCVWEKERWEGFLRSLLKDASIAASTARHTLLFLMISFLRFSFHFLLPHYLSYNVMLGDAFLCFVHVWLSCVTIFVYNVKGRPFRPLLINLLQDLI